MKFSRPIAMTGAFIAITLIIRGACMSEPAAPVRYIQSGPFLEQKVGDGEFFFLFTDHYDHTGYLSPDMPTFLSFGQWSGIREDAAKIFLILDVPLEITIHGGRFARSISEESRHEIIDGHTYKRYRIDFGYGKTATRSGMTQLICTTGLAPGRKVTLYYATEIDGKPLHRKSLPVTIVSIPKPGAPKKLFTFFDTFATSIESYPDFRHFREIGFNRIGGFSDFRGKNITRLVQKSAAAGLELMAWNTETAEDLSPSGGWRAKTRDGKETDAISPTYRGKGLQEWIKRGEGLVDEGIFVHITDPERADGDKICFSHESLREFEGYARRQEPGLKRIDPRVFTEKPSDFPDHMRLWIDFKSEAYAGLYGYYRDRIENHIKKNKPHNRLKLLIYAQPGYRNLKISKTTQSSSIPTIRTSLQDPKKLSKVFDIFSPMIYIDVDERHNHRLDLLEVSEEVRHMREYLNGQDMPIVPALSAGFPYTKLKSDISPGNVVKYQVLEAFGSGAKGVGIYSEGFFDALDMKYFAEAITQVDRVEDIIAEGFPIRPDELIDLNHRTFVKGVRDRKGNAVVLVSEYSKERKTARVMYAGAKGAVTIVDLADDARIPVARSAEQGRAVFEVTLAAERAKMLLIKVND